jgi:hypothetical protein
MGDWFINPLGEDAERRIIGGTPRWEDVPPGWYVCDRCGQPLVPCDWCGRPAMCGDAWCELCQPDG